MCIGYIYNVYYKNKKIHFPILKKWIFCLKQILHSIIHLIIAKAIQINLCYFL